VKEVLRASRTDKERPGLYRVKYGKVLLGHVKSVLYSLFYAMQ